jgi:hypothetical protein
MSPQIIDGRQLTEQGSRTTPVGLQMDSQTAGIACPAEFDPPSLLIAEPAIRHDQDVNIRRQRLGKLLQHTILICVAMVLQGCLINREP